MARKLYMREALEPDCWHLLTARERRKMLKWEQAKEYSGYRAYPTTCAAVFSPIPFDAVDRYTARQLGEIAGWLNTAYQNGKKEGRRTAVAAARGEVVQ